MNIHFRAKALFLAFLFLLLGACHDLNLTNKTSSGGVLSNVVKEITKGNLWYNPGNPGNKKDLLVLIHPYGNGLEDMINYLP